MGIIRVKISFPDRRRRAFPFFSNARLEHGDLNFTLVNFIRTGVSNFRVQFANCLQIVRIVMYVSHMRKQREWMDKKVCDYFCFRSCSFGSGFGY